MGSEKLTIEDLSVIEDVLYKEMSIERLEIANIRCKILMMRAELLRARAPKATTTSEGK
jgi:hypothetical protein